MHTASVKFLKAGGAVLTMDGKRTRLDLRDREIVNALQRLFWFNPLAREPGSVVYRNDAGEVWSSDNFGIPRVGRPLKGEKPTKSALKMRRHRERKAREHG